MLKKERHWYKKKPFGEVYNCLCHGSDKIIGTSSLLKTFLVNVTSGNCDSPWEWL